MNIFETEKLINENIKSCKKNINFAPKPIEINMDKFINHVSIKALQDSFAFDGAVQKKIKSMEEQILNGIVNQVNSWLIKTLIDLGVNEDEISKRVFAIVQNPYEKDQKIHIYIDGAYEFSFSRYSGFVQNEGIFTSWINAEYIPEMKEVNI